MSSDLKCFARPPKFRNRMIMMLCGVVAQGMGLSLLRAINLGTDPVLSDTGRHKFRAIELWNLSVVMPSGDVRFCDQVRPGHDWLWNDRKYVLSGIYF